MAHIDETEDKPTVGELYGTIKDAAVFARLLSEGLRQMHWPDEPFDPRGDLRGATRLMLGKEWTVYR